MLILVAEDEAIIAMALELALHHAGHQVLGPADSVEKALRLADGTTLELALVDINLRDGGDGVTLARTLRARHGVPSLFLSSQVMLARANKDAAWGVISKPYEPEVVLSAVKAVDDLKNGRLPSNVPAELELF